MGHVFFEITIIICLAAILAGIFRLLKQPAILAYILTGIIIGPLGLLALQSKDIIQTMGELGITLLLFMLGLEIKLKELGSIGKIALLTSIGQIGLSFIAGFGITKILGYSSTESIYVGIALVFSSTIVIVKLLSDKRDLSSLYGKISVGVLLLQDFLAIFILILLSSFTNNHTQISIYDLGLIILKAVVLIGWVVLLSQKFFPKVTELFAKSDENLFLISIAWVFGLAAFVSSPFIGFSIEIGGFLAGLALSNSIANYQIIARVKILRDFFIILFFVVLGIQMNFGNIGAIIFPALILSIFVLVIKPVIVMLILGFLGYRKRTSFLTGISLGQISEFSLIILFLGRSVGQISQSIVSLITLVAVITFTISTYLIADNNRLYLLFHKKLSILERRKTKREEIVDPDNVPELKNHVVIVGGDEMGRSILEAIDIDEKVVLVDFNPEVVKRYENTLLNNKNKTIHRLFGDITDLDIQERASLETAKLVISTVPDIEDNLLLLQMMRVENRKAKILVMTYEPQHAIVLYDAGADYVILPHLAGGQQIAKILKEDNLDGIKDLKIKDLKFLS